MIGLILAMLLAMLLLKLQGRARLRVSGTTEKGLRRGLLRATMPQEPTTGPWAASCGLPLLHWALLPRLLLSVMRWMFQQVLLGLRQQLITRRLVRSGIFLRRIVTRSMPMT